MGSIAGVGQSTTTAIWEEAEGGVRSAANLEDAAAAFLNAIYEKYEANMALARVFVTIPYKNLPQGVKCPIRHCEERSDTAVTDRA